MTGYLERLARRTASRVCGVAAQAALSVSVASVLAAVTFWWWELQLAEERDAERVG